MNFISVDYFVFLVAVLAIHWSLPARWRNPFLVPASWLFYGYIHAWFLLPFLATTLIDYFVARAIEGRASLDSIEPPRTGRRWLLAISVVSNLGLLAVFKYCDFFIENINAMLMALHLAVPLSLLHIVLPAGISFYTFQSIGYVVDVYRGDVRACRRFADYALFVAFFPLLVAGPIQRAGELLAQIRAPRWLSPEDFHRAVCLLVWGFFKKMVIADNVAVTANKIFALRDPSFPILWAGVFAFCVQIYADFSGYTDIARGSARLFGFQLTGNFNNPYLAQSPSDFWRRWHISLSTYLRDYLYRPLGGSRQGEVRTAWNLILVFFATGFWHGASWNFIFWGLYYAVLSIAYRAAGVERTAHRGWSVALRVALMFVLTNIGWLIFREHDVIQLWHDLTLSPFAAPQGDVKVATYLITLTCVYAAPLILRSLWDLLLKPRLNAEAWPLRFRLPLESGFAALVFFAVLAFGSGAHQDFIYFEF